MHLKECHPCCVYQNYSRSKIREVAVKKHNYICRYNNLPTTCFGLFTTSFFLLSYTLLTTKPDAHLTFQLGKGPTPQRHTTTSAYHCDTRPPMLQDPTPRAQLMYTPSEHMLAPTPILPQTPYICKRDLVPHTYTYNRHFPLTLYPNLKMAYQGRNM